MADSNRTRFSWAEEATFGVDPAAGYDILRITSDSLGQDTSFNSSPEIRTSREIRELNRTNRGVSGNIASTCYFGGAANQGVSAFYRYAMGSPGDYSTGDSGAGTPTEIVSAAACTMTLFNTITIDAGSWTTNPAVGDWIHVTGFTATADNGWYKVISFTSSVIVIDYTLSANETSSSLTIFGSSFAAPGNNLQTLHFQREYTESGLANAALFGGCAVNSWEFNAEGQEIITNSFDIVGVSETSAASPTATTASTNTAAMTAIDGVQFVRFNGDDICALGTSFTVANNIRQRYCLGTFGPEAHRIGDLIVTGNIQLYLENSSTGETALEMMDYYLNNTAGRFAIGVSDEVTGRGNAKVFDFPNVEFTAGRRVVGGRNQDVIVDLAFQALYDSTDAATMGVHLWTSA
jgi:hypothetical protein